MDSAPLAGYREDHSKEMVERVRAVVLELGHAEWKRRDRAAAQLLALGPSAASVLKSLREGQPPEAQNTIDDLLKKFKDAKQAAKAPPVQPVQPGPLADPVEPVAPAVDAPPADAAPDVQLRIEGAAPRG